MIAPHINIEHFYSHFNTPITAIDCGTMCAPHNPHGIPFCCDICCAVPSVYREEWEFLRSHTDLWHEWHGDECPEEPVNPRILQQDSPEYMCLLACSGPAFCRREYRSSSCRQFPFFPYITADDRFIGLAHHWDFEATCWVISNLGAVTVEFRHEFIAAYDDLFTHWQEEYESYAWLSADMREDFIKLHRRIPILHRNGKNYMLSPRSEKLTQITVDQFPRFGMYKEQRKQNYHPLAAIG